MIAVTGANGLLGSFIVRKLIQEQKSFVAIKRAGSDTSLLQDVADKIQWRTADVLNPLMLSDALEGCTQVIHSAAVVSFNPWQADNVLEINSIGTRNIVNACFHQNIKRLVHISSVAALGRQKEQTIIREDNKWVENPLNSVYADSKYKAELEVFRGQEEGLNTVILNPSVILAPADWNRSSAKLFRYVWHQRPFYIDASLNYVDVRDVASCAYKLLQSNFEAERFIVSAGNISFKNFFEKTANKFDVKPPSVRLSKSIVKSVARFERIRTWFTRSEPLITRETAQLVGAQFLYDNKKIKNNLNFEFQTLDNTLEWCCDYYNRKFNSKK
ncbi:MAG TPA: NAD-dependent epimerase/dehydratase family protein [Chryseolinea sp.]|nr:NAD-dependent epimerase/dehydratase family protein [Chryseolinea sp.]